MGNGNSVHEKREAEFNERTGIVSVSMPVKIIYAMINGQSCGFGLIDRKSKTFAMDETGWLFTKKFHAHDEGFMAPRLEIEYEGPEAGEGSGAYNADNIAITVSNGMADSPAVHASVKTNAACDLPVIPQELDQDDDNAAAAFSIRKEAFTLFVLDELSKVNPISGNVLEYDPDAYRTGDEENIAAYGSGIFDGTTVRMAGVAGEKMAFQMVFRNDTVEDMKFQVRIERNPLLPCSISVSKAWYLSADDAWYPEVAVPLLDIFQYRDPKSDNNGNCPQGKVADAENGRPVCHDKSSNPETGNSFLFCVPFEEYHIPGQKYQSILFEVHLSDECKAGTCLVVLDISDKAGNLRLPVHIQIEEMRLEKADFAYELLGYSPVPGFMGSDYGDEQYFNIEEAYCRTAFRHGMFVNIVPYLQSGDVHPGFCPDIEVRDDIPIITDWTGWDRHFSRYLDGSYLSSETGRDIPVSHLFVPIHENWPMPVSRYYKIKPSTRKYPDVVNECYLKNTTIENDFMPEYREGIKKIFKEFITHIDEKGWNNTKFIWYLNNKHYWKDRKYQMDWMKCSSASSWWNLDEPVVLSDWEAVAYYGGILKEAQAETGSGRNILFRVDISKYHSQFGSLDGLMDIACLNTVPFSLMEDTARARKEKFGEEYWNYGHMSDIRSPGTESCVNVMNVYLKGGTGFLPWNNYGTDKAYDVPTATAGLYPGNRFNLDGPAVSLRLKAACKGLQMLDYLQALKCRCGYDEWQMKSFVNAFLNLDSKSFRAYREDAGTLKYAMNPVHNLKKMKKAILRLLRAPE
jgi:hypothetical protein